MTRQTDDVYTLSFLTKYRHSSLTYNGFNHSLILIIIPVNYSSKCPPWVWRLTTDVSCPDRSPLYADCQSPNNPDQGLGLPASAARSDLTQPRTSSRYGLMFWLSRRATGPRERLTPDNILHKLSRYTTLLRVGSSTLRFVRIMNNTIFPYYKYVIITQFLPRFYT